MARGGQFRTRTGAARNLDVGELDGLVGYHVRRAQATIFEDFARHVAELEITPGQFGLLTLIRANPGVSQQDLALAIGLDKSTVNPVIDRLERRGLVTREPADHDRRVKALALSEAGAALHAQVGARVRQHEAGIGDALTQDERTTLLRLLKRIVAD